MIAVWKITNLLSFNEISVFSHLWMVPTFHCIIGVVFTLPHKFLWIMLDYQWKFRILWNSMGSVTSKGGGGNGDRQGRQEGVVITKEEGRIGKKVKTFIQHTLGVSPRFSLFTLRKMPKELQPKRRHHRGIFPSFVWKGWALGMVLVCTTSNFLPFSFNFILLTTNPQGAKRFSRGLDGRVEKPMTGTLALRAATRT